MFSHNNDNEKLEPQRISDDYETKNNEKKAHIDKSNIQETGEVNSKRKCDDCYR